MSPKSRIWVLMAILGKSQLRHSSTKKLRAIRIKVKKRKKMISFVKTSVALLPPQIMDPLSPDLSRAVALALALILVLVLAISVVLGRVLALAISLALALALTVALALALAIVLTVVIILILVLKIAG